MSSNLYKLPTIIGILIAVFAAGFWTVKFYQSLKKEDMRPSTNYLVFPIILIMLFANGCSNAQQFTLAARNVMNNISSSANSVIDADVNIRAANETIDNESLSQNMMVRLYGQCVASPDLNKIRTCAESTRIQINDWISGAALAVQTGSNVQYNVQLDKFYRQMKERNNSWYSSIIDMTTKREKANASVNEAAGLPNAAPNQSGGQQKPAFSVLDTPYYNSIDPSIRLSK